MNIHPDKPQNAAKLNITSRKTDMKSIAIFNNKGGVGKTTLLCNLASYILQEHHKKVLIIDADPQCNASIYLMKETEIEDIYSKDNPETIAKIIEPIRKGEGQIALDEIPIKRSVGFKVDVILGDTTFATFEDTLSKDWSDVLSGELRGIRTTLMFYNLLKQLESKYDYVLFDVGPALGAINRSVLMACDYFIMPMSSDIFCVKAIDNIASTLIQWKRKLNRGLTDFNESANAGDKIDFESKISFLGYLNLQYTSKKKDGVAQPVKAYDKIISAMPNRIEIKLSELYNQEHKNSLKLGDIPTLNSLIPLSQMAHKPIFQLDGGDGVVGAHFKKVRDFRETMDVIAANVLKNISNND